MKRIKRNEASKEQAYAMHKLNLHRRFFDISRKKNCNLLAQNVADKFLNGQTTSLKN